MCGIAGFYSNKYNKEDLVKMTNALTHRGPDAEGFYYNDNEGIGLGHRRLSIIDLSSSANQPMKSHCGRYIMVFNGEIYNFNEIKKKIKGFKPKTNSDSEIILAAFAFWGIKFINELNGMFSISIYDEIDKKIYLFRDRIGIKPLYYYFNDGDLIFSSELKAINQIITKKRINYHSVCAYLHLGYIPSNKTIYEDVYKLNPGSYVEYFNNKLIEKSYWNIKDKIHLNTIDDFNISKIRLKSLIQDSVKKRLISDVPIGTFLSGGTDSSLISAVAQEINGSPINTFSIGFEKAKYNECHHAKKVAKYIGSNHREFVLKEQDAMSELESIMENFDEPFADSSALPTLLVSKMAKKDVTVCLSGDGGDELFMGYGSYNWGNRLSNPFIWYSRRHISWLLSKSKNHRKKRAGLVFNSPKKNWKSHIFSQEQHFFCEKEIVDLIDKSNFSIIDEINRPKPLERKLNNSERQAFFDLNNYLVDDLLVKVDRSSMYTSLEVRVPLLDHNIVEYAFNLNKNLKLNKGIQKHILKEIMYDYVPKKIMDRPKWGFSIPLEEWLKKDLNYLISQFLSKSAINEIGVLNYLNVKKLLIKFENGESYLYNRIWNLIILQKFMLKTL
jgi:asparagine synthase (glutamine-hydrolysing)